jgi:hypothetical protein
MEINPYEYNYNRIARNVLAIICVILLAFSARQCSDKNTALASAEALTSKVESYKLKTGELVKSQQIAILEKENLQKNIIDKDAKLKEMASKFSKVTAIQTIASVKTSIPKTTVAFETPITIKEVDTTTGKLMFKRNGSFVEPSKYKWYEFGYNVTQDSLTIEPFYTWTDIKRVDGYKRKWFLGKKTYHSDIMFTNPYINTGEVQTYQVAVPVKWHETRVFNIALGVALKTIFK